MAQTRPLPFRFHDDAMMIMALTDNGRHTFIVYENEPQRTPQSVWQFARMMPQLVQHGLMTWDLLESGVHKFSKTRSGLEYYNRFKGQGNG